MKIIDALKKEAVLVDLKARDKKGVIEELIAPLARIAGVRSQDLARVLLDRERLGSTGIGSGVGIPHGKLKGFPSLMIGFGISRKGVDFESIDGELTHIFFLLVTPEDTIDMHLRLLARISRVLKNDMFRQRLLQVKTPEEVMAVIREEDDAV